MKMIILTLYSVLGVLFGMKFKAKNRVSLENDIMRIMRLDGFNKTNNQLNITTGGEAEMLRQQCKLKFYYLF